MNYYGQNQKLEQLSNKSKKKGMAIMIGVLIIIVLLFQLFKFLPFDLHYNTKTRELDVETWVRYKPYNLGSMTQEQKEQYAKDYMLDNYGVEVNVKKFGIPGSTTDFSRFYTMATVSPIDSDVPFDTYNIYFKGNGKICDDYYLRDIQSFVTQQVKNDISDLPYEYSVVTRTCTLSPYFPTYKMKKMAKENPLDFLKLKRTYTVIYYFFSTDCIEYKEEIRDFLESKTNYMNADGNLYFVDGDINQIDLSNIDPSTLLAFY